MDAEDDYTEYVLKEIAEEYAKCFPDVQTDTPSENGGLLGG